MSDDECATVYWDEPPRKSTVRITCTHTDGDEIVVETIEFDRETHEQRTVRTERVPLNELTGGREP